MAEPVALAASETGSYFRWLLMAVPAGTPQPVIDRLHREITAVQNSEEVQQQLAKDGAVVVQVSATEAARFYLAEIDKWAKVVKEANIKVD